MNEKTQESITVENKEEKKKPEEKKTPEQIQQELTLKSMIDLIKYPVLTQKTFTILANNRQYTFDVDKRLTKTQIKKLFENIFQVNVISVNTHIPPRKTVRVGVVRGYRPSYKRVILTLKEGQSINYNSRMDVTKIQNKDSKKSTTVNSTNSTNFTNSTNS